MNKQSMQKVGALFQELNAISELLAECELQSGEPVIFPDACLSLSEHMRALARGCESQPVIRTIHHFACTGGTLISKCISALPNVFLLSEVHPFSELEIPVGKPVFTPSNLSKLARYSRIPMVDTLADEIFTDSIKAIHRHLESIGGQLVLRDHTHSDYCVGPSVARKPKVNSILGAIFTIYSVATIRDPIDSYMSLIKNDWAKFEPNCLDEYCRRMLLFLDNFDRGSIFRYEDFLDEPRGVMERICEKLNIAYDDSFSEVFDMFAVTGDSGRSGAKISKRVRREIDGDILTQAASSEFYDAVCSKFNYLKVA